MKTREPIFASGAPFFAAAFAAVLGGTYLLHGVTLADWAMWGTAVIALLSFLPWVWIGLAVVIVGLVLNGGGVGPYDKVTEDKDGLFASGLIVGLVFAVLLLR